MIQFHIHSNHGSTFFEKKGFKDGLILVNSSGPLYEGVGSMQGSNDDCLPMKGNTQGGDATTVLAIE